MEGFVAQTLNDFETGKITRRRLIETLTVAATTAYAADGASAQSAPDPALKAQLINHISYTCLDFRKTADWYSKILNLDQVGLTARDVVLPFGKKGDLPYNVTAKDVPLSHLIIRSRDPGGPPPRSGEAPAPTPQASIQHICFTVADFNQERALTTLTAAGVKNVRKAGSNSVHMDDLNGYDIQIAGLDLNALSSGG
jgi:glyoxylase I family protein